MTSNLQSPTIRYQQGTLVFDHFAPDGLDLIHAFVAKDPRTLEVRAQPRHYRDIVQLLREHGVGYTDEARKYDRMAFSFMDEITPRKHQAEALEAWNQAGRAGVVELPTGAGKTILAMMAMAATQRPTLIIVPTIDLMQQWHAVVKRFFGLNASLLGGGSHEISAVTISTYDSAAIHAERLGPQFGLVVFDECHHLPGPQYSMIALCSLAPFRLGLSATVERIDGKEEMIYNLIGPQVYRGHIAELEAKTLAPYQIVQIQVQMTPDEWEAYSEARTIYRDFVRRNQISFASPQGWGRFLIAVARAPDGRKAMTAYREQKRLAQSSQSKVTELWRIVRDHKGERMIVFTDENAMAYDIGREFFIPVITYHTKAKERVRILDDFRAGRITMIATSKVLNEGVDVPEASVGVVISGSGTVREHVQRLGRILRHKEGKTAVLYEVISRGTNEEYTNERRRQHSAYQRPSAVYQS